jgi:hypothetical protein
MKRFVSFYLLAPLVFARAALALDLLELRQPANCMDGLEMASIAPPPPPVVNKDEIFDPKSLKELLPKQIARDEKGTVVMNKIADNGLRKIMASESFKSSQFGQLNARVQEKTRIEMSLQDNNNHLQHKVNAQIQPFQGTAVISYKGFFGLDYSLQPASDTQKIKVEQMVADKKVFFENRQLRSNTLNQIGVAWDW